MDIALFRLPHGQAWLGEGPFAEAAEPPPGTSFYVNDFSLSDPKPWKIPARCTVIQAGQPWPHAPLTAPQVVWKKPDPEIFEHVFRSIRKDLQSRRLRKMVPALTEEGSLHHGEMAELLHRVFTAPAGFWGYARVQGDTGLVGATPELLLQQTGNHLHTMALAGTASPQETADFESDTKEIEEHEIVAGFLEGVLQPLGAVTRSPREVADAAGLTHFRTRLEVALNQEPDWAQLIASLHPTPAVGCLPRDPATMARLMAIRQRLEVPAFFGAPFGLKTEDSFSCVVSIRGLCWEQERVWLPSGCGLVRGSAFDHEWRELRLKRDAVAQLLGL